MQKTITVNISGVNFYINEDAHQRLQAYLNSIEIRFKGTEGGDEIIADIESRIAELFTQKINSVLNVVTIEMVDETISIMGQPEDFSGEAQPSSHESQYTSYQVPPHKRLYRDTDNRILGGVCAGLAAYFNTDPTIVRVLAVILTLMSGGLFYIILWIVMPKAITTAQKLEMKGETVTIDNIEKTIKDEFEEVKKSFSKMRDNNNVKQGLSYFDKMNQRDRTILIVVGVVLALFVVKKMAHGLFLGIGNVFNGFFHFPFHSNIPFVTLLPVMLVLLGIGLIHKPLLKPMLWIMALILAISAVLFLVFNIWNGPYFINF